MECTYSGITFLPHVSGRPEVTSGFIFLLGDLKGWWEGAPDATTVVDHWSGDGTVGMPGRLGGRTVEVTGTILARRDTIRQALDFIQRPRRGVFRAGDLEADVQRTGLELTKVNETTYEFALYLRADDPHRYTIHSDPLPSGQFVSVTNAGDVKASPLLTMIGPLSAGLTIEHTAGTWTLNHPIGAGQTWEAAFRDGDLWWGGRRQFVPTTGPRPVVPMGTSTFRATYAGGGSVSLRRFEAWT